MESKDGFNRVYKTNFHLLLVCHIPYNFFILFFFIFDNLGRPRHDRYSIGFKYGKWAWKRIDDVDRDLTDGL